MKRLLYAVPVVALVACGGGNSTCKVGDNSTCDSGKVCEPIQGSDKPGCFEPVVVQGRVFDVGTDAGVANAQVTAEEVTGRSVGQVAVTGADGTYSLVVPTTRSDDKGTPIGQTLTLSAAAHDYTPFPSGFRVALPVDTTGATAGAADQPLVVTGGPTQIGLEKLPADRVGLPSISGTVDVKTADGGTSDAEILVAATQTNSQTPATFTARADSNGNYTLFNIPAGDYSVQAYRRGANYTPATASVASADVPNVNLSLSPTPAATLDGSVDIVATTGVTSVVMALESTFNNTLERGTLVPGLRSPDPGTAPNVVSSFSISGVPDGKYVVLAGFENDGMVRDPDSALGGTAIQHVEIKDGAVVNPPSAFKVTNAIAMVGPGANGSEDVSGTPTFSWHPYSSAKTYDIQVFDNLGNEIWKQTGISATTTDPQSIAYGGSTALTPGATYQWRVSAYDQNGNPISLTEDLKGVFRIAQ